MPRSAGASPGERRAGAPCDPRGWAPPIAWPRFRGPDGDRQGRAGRRHRGCSLRRNMLPSGKAAAVERLPRSGSPHRPVASESAQLGRQHGDSRPSRANAASGPSGRRTSWPAPTTVLFHRRRARGNGPTRRLPFARSLPSTRVKTPPDGIAGRRPGRGGPSCGTLRCEAKNQAASEHGADVSRPKFRVREIGAFRASDTAGHGQPAGHEDEP